MTAEDTMLKKPSKDFSNKSKDKKKNKSARFSESSSDSGEGFILSEDENIQFINNNNNNNHHLNPMAISDYTPGIVFVSIHCFFLYFLFFFFYGNSQLFLSTHAQHILC